MVYIVDGEAHPGHRPRDSDEYKRQATVFQVDDSLVLNLNQSNSGQSHLTRYHLIGCAACPWFHRTMLIRAHSPTLYKHLQVSLIDPIRNDDVGWSFSTEKDSPYRNNFSDQVHLKDVYIGSDPHYTGNVTTPVLLDTETNTIVCNESRDLLKLLQRSTDDLDYLYPKGMEEKIDSCGLKFQMEFNGAVYKSGLARSQEAYENAVNTIFQALDNLELMLSGSRFVLSNDAPTLADLMILPALLRFDIVYFILFKCAKRRLKSYYNIINYARDLFQASWIDNDDERKSAIAERISESTPFHDIARHYYSTFTSANPNQVVDASWQAAHDEFSRSHDRAAVKPLSDEQRAALQATGTQVEQTDANDRRARGEFVRGVSAHRNWIGEDEQFPPESGRYTLIIANNCPWCHRCLTALQVLGLQNAIRVDVCFYRRHPDRGWQFLPSAEELRPYENHADLSRRIAEKDSTFGKQFVREIYQECGSTEKSVPILLDSIAKSIVSNESAEIIRMLNVYMRPKCSPPDSNIPDLYPPVLRDEIDRINALVYDTINNGAYRAGFTSDQEKHDNARDKYFETLDYVNELLAHRRFLLGEHITEADVRLFPTLARHDCCYYLRMKLSRGMIMDYPNLSRWLRDMFRIPGVAESWFVDDVIRGYFGRTGNNLIPLSRRQDVGGALGAWY